MNITISEIKAKVSDNPHSYIYVKDEKYRYLEANNNVLSFLGFTYIDQLIGKTDKDLFMPCFAKQYIQHDKAAAAAGRLHTMESMLTQDGDILHMYVQKYRFYEPKTKKSGIVGISQLFTNHMMQILMPMLDCVPFNDEDSNNSLFSTMVNRYAKEPLTDNEIHVFYYILSGLTQKQIASKLEISFRTIEDYSNRIKKKLKCRGKSELFEFAIKYNLISIMPILMES